MNFINDVWNKAKKLNKTIVLPESDDPRVLKAAEIILISKIAKIVLIGNGAEIKDIATKERIDLSTAQIINPADEKPLNFAAQMVVDAKADGMVAGAIHYSSEIIKIAIKEIGLATGQTKLSSFFVVILQDKSLRGEGVFFFADCAVVPAPNQQELEEIARQTANSFKTLTGREPHLAMLRAHQDIPFEKANVFIFPNLNAGNIGYKIVQRLAAATIIGPIFQGCAKPVNDLSRGCSVDEIVNVVAITTVLV